MDTPMDIAHDRWWQAHLGMCETCAYRKRDKTGKYICNCDESENWGHPSDDVYGCEDYFEGKMI